MSFSRHAVAAALLIALSGGAFGQEPTPKPGDAEASADTDKARPPAKPAPSPEPLAADDREKAGPANETKAENSDISAKKGKDAEKAGKTEPPRPLPKETEQEYAACRLALALLGTVYEERSKITEADNPECGINKPLHVTEILPGLTLQGGAIMRCDTARALGLWAQQFLRPASANLPGAPRLTGLQLGTTYDCRARNGTGKKRPKMSEHALGNAIDIAAFEFDDGQSLTVEPRKDTGDLLEAFQRAARGSACLYFTTVLGPGSNGAHDDHLHLDVKARKNGWRLCQ